MDDLPDELFYQIFKQCDFPTLMKLRQVSRRFYKIVNYILYFKRNLVLDYSKYINIENLEDIRVIEMDKLLRFINNYMNNLRDITFGLIPIRITMSGLIQLASAHSKLETLQFDQHSQLPVIEKDSLYALPYFKKLKNLTLRGWNTVEPKVRRGCAHRTDMLPFRGLIPLESLIIDCKKDTVVNVLQEMQRSLILLSNLKLVQLHIYLSNVDLPGVLSWFLQSHPDLEQVHVSGVLFSSEAQVQRFYRSILSLPNLQKIFLKNCKAISALDNKLADRYLNEACRLQIGAEGIVSSLRFLPEGTP